jgi:hypothetical protein
MPGLTEEQRVLLLEWQDISGKALDTYAENWAAGQVSLADFERLFKAEVRDLYVASGWTARGSIEATTYADYGRIGWMLRDQYGYTHEFFQEISQGNLSLEQIKARGRLYVASSRQAAEATAQNAAGMPQLPAQPGDGSTRCRTNCKCGWRIEKVKDGFDCFWELNPAEHCEDCKDRSEKWSPLRVRFGQVVEGGSQSSGENA